MFADPTQIYLRLKILSAANVFPAAISMKSHMCVFCLYNLVGGIPTLWKIWVRQLGWLFPIPSGKRLHNYGKSSFLMGKSTIWKNKISRRRSPTAVGFKQWSSFATQDGLMMAGTGFHSRFFFCEDSSHLQWAWHHSSLAKGLKPKQG